MNAKLAAANVALKQGRKADAADHLIEALKDEPELSQSIYAALLDLLLELRRTADGLFWSAEGLKRAPKDYALLNLRGAFLRLAGQRDEAHHLFDRAIKLRPSELAARANKGHLYNDAKNGAAAEVVFTALVRQHPRIAELHRSLGLALSHQGKLEPAERRFRQATLLDPANINAVLDLSAVQQRRGNADEALATLEGAMIRNPTTPRLPRAKAVMLRHAGRSDAAAAYLHSLPIQHGAQAWFHYELARNLSHTSPDLATAHFRRAIELDPHDKDFYLLLAEHLLRQSTAAPGRNVDNAYAVLKSFPPTPAPGPYESRIRAQILGRAIDFEGLRSLGGFSELGRTWAEAGLHTALLNHLGRVETAEDRRELVQQHRAWGDKLIARAERQPIRRPSRSRTTGKIRVGFMSSDLREHPVTYFAWPLFELFDRNRFEVYCYSFFPAPKPSPLQSKLTEMVDVFRWHPNIGDREAAQIIADDDLDILFELGGTTYLNKLEVMAWKPARICSSWLAYPHSAGLSTIDYLVLDPYLAPPDPELLIERPLMMPHSWITMSGRAFPDSYKINPVPPLVRNGFPTFGTANNTYKFTAAMLRTWADVMRAVPSSRFIFLRSDAGADIVRRNFLAIFEGQGVSAERIEFRAIEGAHMPHYNDIDIALDTFPQTGGTTTCEALWMGVPTISLVGEAMFERLSYSILSNAGLADLCCKSATEYIEVATRLAGDPDRLLALRNGLREQIRASPLGKPDQFARDFYELVARTVAGEPGQ